MNNTPPKFFINYWTIMPADTNYMFPLVFGGAMMSQVDLAVATHVRQLLDFSECDKAVTYKADFKFLGPAYSGDTIEIVSECTEVRDNALGFTIRVYRIPKPTIGIRKTEKELIGQHYLVFVTKLEDKFHPHKLKDKL